MARPRVKMLKRGSRDLLRSSEVEADMSRRASDVANAAGPGFDDRTVVGRQRVLSGVFATSWDAYVAESRNHALTRALDAAQ